LLGYSVDLLMYERLADRKDGEVVDFSRL
jgi:hypothetical protein